MYGVQKMTNFKILAVDPGGTTGIATYSALRIMNPNTNQYEYMDESFWGTQLGPEKHHDELDMLLGMQHVENYTIVCESFEYRNRSRAGLVLVSQQYIGVIERFAQERKVQLVMQSSSVGKITKKSFVRKENLERLGLWEIGMGGRLNHMADAYGHILQYMVKNNIQKSDLLERGWR